MISPPHLFHTLNIMFYLHFPSINQCLCSFFLFSFSELPSTSKSLWLKNTLYDFLSYRSPVNEFSKFLSVCKYLYFIFNFDKKKNFTSCRRIAMLAIIISSSSSYWEDLNILLFLLLILISCVSQAYVNYNPYKSTAAYLRYCLLGHFFF